MRKTVTVLLILGFLIAFSAVTPLPVKAEPKTIVVPDDYPTIQEAIGNASEGDTVFVKKGIYKENVIVDRPVSLLGEDSAETVIEGQVYRYGPFYTIRIQANNVEISGFTITGTLTGITTDGSPYGCKIISNNIEDNFETGISVSYGENWVLSENNITRNGMYGIYICSSNSVVSNNNVSGNQAAGIIVDSCTNVTISGNSITDNGVSDYGEGGLELRWDGPFYVYGNNITENQGYGVEFAEGCYNSTVHDNNIMRNDVGVELFNFPLNGNDGLIGSGNVVYRNNLVDNSQQAVVEKTWRYAKNFVNYTGDNGTDIVSWDNGEEGNYWSDYSGQGKYVIDENNVDHHPLTQQVDISTKAPELSTIIATLAVIIVVCVVGAGLLLVYFKKRKR